MWETARASRHTTRWFEMRRGDAADVHLLIQFTRALRASPDAPVGFVFDDVGGRFSQLWNALLNEVTVGSGILLLGSIREEDTLMLASRSRAREVRPLMEEAVAEKIWRQLVEQGQTNWAGWREPWAKSGGLLLEYTHILTRGERLKSILAEQIDHGSASPGMKNWRFSVLLPLPGRQARRLMSADCRRFLALNKAHLRERYVDSLMNIWFPHQWMVS